MVVVSSLRLLWPLRLITAGSLSPTDVARQSNLEWYDAKWKADGTGSMPIGNGDVTANVWVDGDTGELVLLTGKSDVFDENAQPVHVGVVRVAFDPPLWDPGSPAPLPPTPGSGHALDSYTKADSTIVKQPAQFAPPDGWKCDSKELCPEQSAELCDAIGDACQSFSLHPTWGGGVTPELSTTLEGEHRAGTEDWTLYTKPASPPSPSPPPAGNFKQTLNLPEASIDIETLHVKVRVWADSTTSAMRVVASSTDGSDFKVTARIVPYRSAEKTQLGRGFCHDRFDSPDVVVGKERPDGLSNAVVWYHRNADDAAYFSDTMLDQGVSAADEGLHDPFAGLTFGGAIFSEELVLAGGSFRELAGSKLNSLSLSVALHTEQAAADDWMTELSTVVSAAPTAGWQDALATHVSEWEQIWSRSVLHVTASAGAAAGDQTAAKQVMDHAHWERFMELIQGMKASSPMKFNGQAFTVNYEGKGWDYRSWGASYWWQNTRQPYYNSLAQGDVDVLRSMLGFYHRMLPYVQKRTAAQFNGTETPITGGVAALYPETTTQFGCYEPSDWGCKSAGHREHGASSNQYIRFHYTGNLELCLLFLDDHAVTQDADYFRDHGLPVCTAVLEGFRQRFPNADPATGKTDLWPSQCLETYQCLDPTSRSKCPGNPATDIAGLQAVLSRLLALPASLVPQASDERARWSHQLGSLPAMPIANGKILPAASGASSRHNSENTALYAVHPFRVYGNGKADLDVAQATYQHRPSPCNNGWCQDIIDAAMLNLTDDAVKMVAQRAAAGPATGFRFPGFAQHYQDYEPSLDHYAFMRTAVNYMLMSPLDDATQGILLFPTWPVDRWDVSFKYTAPLNTVIEAACEGGVLTKLVVTPAARAKDVKVMNCRDTGDLAATYVV